MDKNCMKMKTANRKYDAPEIEEETMIDDWIESEDDENGESNIDLSFMNEHILTYNKSYELPDGKYTMLIEDAYLDRSENGIPLFRWTLQVIDDDQYEGTRIYRQNTLCDSKKSIERFLKDLRIVQIVLKKADYIKSVDFKRRLIGIKLRVQVVTKNETTQYYLLKKV
jgi:hypothetical protein